jgi:hypothetical protein
MCGALRAADAGKKAVLMGWNCTAFSMVTGKIGLRSKWKWSA